MPVVSTAPSSEGSCFAAERIDPAHAALAVLLGLNGLRVSGVLGRHREPRLRARPPDPAHRRQGQQARRDPAGAPDGPDHRPGHRRADVGGDPAPPRRQPPRPAHRPPLGALDRQAGRHRRSPPAHASGRWPPGGRLSSCRVPQGTSPTSLAGPGDAYIDPFSSGARPRARLRRRGHNGGKGRTRSLGAKLAEVRPPSDLATVGSHQHGSAQVEVQR